MATGTVTLEKTYFETLLRRAQCQSSGVDYNTPVHLPTVSIPKVDHDNLLSAARQYANLRRNLYKGGIAEETLAILIRDETEDIEIGGTNLYSTINDDCNGRTYLAQKSISNHGVCGQDDTFGRNMVRNSRNGELRQHDSNRFQNHTQGNDDFEFIPDGPIDDSFDGTSGHNECPAKVQRQQYDKFAKRTVQLVSLSEGVTHADIVDTVRGGMLLDIYLRTYDRTASISFLEEAHAQEFFRYVKRHDLYIRGKRAEIRWSDRQFILPSHVANKIALGATRNLVIHNRGQVHTEESIRHDLEHIHNLVVIRVTFNGPSAHISTNSVHNAMFARTCMMSRSVYKGAKIDWDIDECAGLMELRQKSRKEIVPPKKKDGPLMNRFQLLNMDSTDDESLEGSRDSGGVGFQTTVSPTITGLKA